MNYKKIVISLLSVSVVACNGFYTPYQPWQPAFNSFRPSQAIDRFQIQDNLVVDTYSNLMWTRCFLGTTWNGYGCDGFTAVYNWKDAQTASKAANYFGYSDWRIPTLEELKTLAERTTPASETSIPYLNQFVFPTPNCYGINEEFDNDAHSCWHWTSTPIGGSEYYASIIYFGYGYGSGNYETDAFALRLVRNNR